ncbi:hypothetical protein RJ639_031452 [Escallonia herrerae]|uniref:Uncharacterized protein n=1 Tax=Escallonia herrerae TaxID=1293975 RepID=A0AA89BNR2_9ASTE|nr:hypothetical protein RJ639_031452 [Escallonia herrerae]
MGSGGKREHTQAKRKGRLALGINRANNPKSNRVKKTKKKVENKTTNGTKNSNHKSVVQLATPSQQLSFFLNQYQSATGAHLSSIELESIKDECVVELSQTLAQDASTIGEHMKAAFGSSWKKVLCEKQLPEGEVEPGNPALLVISLSALRSLEVLRGLRPLARECQAAKLFSKHMKVEDQVSFLKNHINIASGTPSRDEFWALYKSYFHQRLVEGDVRICLYGPVTVTPELFGGFNSPLTYNAYHLYIEECQKHS